jgi:hypothetical protein
MLILDTKSMGACPRTKISNTHSEIAERGAIDARIIAISKTAADNEIAYMAQITTVSRDSKISSH